MDMFATDAPLGGKVGYKFNKSASELSVTFMWFQPHIISDFLYACTMLT